MSKAKQDFACKDRGGAYEYSVLNNNALCRDGSYVEWESLIITQEYYPEANIEHE